ncbi:MAG TPA: bifunctional shikimate kinase/3-dehydroquinate synthase [Candidatus Dormibacteraeota bacterium]|nr:bifunctional shikimate kinase/3-dehydroquinate synthase [Candidatus Dormibacteraeota bacterium]
MALSSPPPTRAATPAAAATTDVELVIVGLPGSGKTAVGKRVAARHGAVFVDLDEVIERAAGARVPDVFASEGEAGFRRRERAAIEALGAPDAGPELKRVIAPGGGAIVDPRNRWRLFRGRRAVWLDVRPEVVAQRLRRSPNVRPLIASRDPMGTIRDLAASRLRFYATATRVHGVAEMASVVDTVEASLDVPAAPGTVLLRADTRIGRIVIGDGILAREVVAALGALDARRAILVSEPGAWAAVGEGLARDLGATGWTVDHVLLPQGEDAKRLSVIEAAASQLARLRVERREPIVAVGGGALGDAAGFLAATYLRGVPFIQVPTTLVAQLDSSIGGKTGVDLDYGKNLVGAFHQPAAIVIDIAVLESLDVRQRRAALGEAVKMAALGDEPLFETLEASGAAIAAGDGAAVESGALAEVVERAAWAKIEVVVADEREAGGRIALNLGHTLGHAVEAAAGFHALLHGEAVAYGLRAAVRIGVARGVTPPERAERIERLLDMLELGAAPLSLDLDEVLDLVAIDKKHALGALRWVLPTADGHAVDAEVPADLARDAAAGVLAGRAVPVSTAAGSAR